MTLRKRDTVRKSGLKVFQFFDEVDLSNGSDYDYWNRPITYGAEWSWLVNDNGLPALSPVDDTVGPLNHMVRVPPDPDSDRTFSQHFSALAVEVTDVGPPIKVRPIFDVEGSPFTLDVDLAEFEVVAPSSYTATVGDAGSVWQASSLAGKQLVFLPAVASSSGGGSGDASWYGDGSDGAVDFDGTNTYTAFATKVDPAGAPTKHVYELIRDVDATTVTVRNNITLHANGYRLRATTSITVDSGGTICNTGFVVGSIGFHVNGGTIGPVIGVGPTLDNGASAPAHAFTLGGAGGDGGADDAGNPGFTGGGVPAVPGTLGDMHALPHFALAAWWSGTGDGSGGAAGWYPVWSGAPGGGSADGGYGGDPGGVILLMSPSITNNGSIHCNGQAGDAGVGTDGGAGGGGGGVALAFCPSFSGSAMTANGGAGGAAGSGAAVAGANGQNGYVAVMTP